MAAWTGYGWLAYAFVIGSSAAASELLSLLFGKEFANQYSILQALLAFVMASIACWPIGRHLNRSLPLRVFDSDWAWEGHTTAHSAFFVRLEYGALAGIPFLIGIAITGWDGMLRR